MVELLRGPVVEPLSERYESIEELGFWKRAVWPQLALYVRSPGVRGARVKDAP